MTHRIGQEVPQYNGGTVVGASAITVTSGINAAWRDQNPGPAAPRPGWKIYFIDEGNITYLFGASLCWFSLDFAFCGLGINNPRVIAQIWASEHITNTTAAHHTPVWGNPSQPDLSIYDVLKQDGVRSIITVSIGSLLGSIIIIKMIDFVSRKAWLAWSFVGMAVLFGVVGGSYFSVAGTDMHALTITLYVFSQLLFNLGPNTLAYIIPAEIFPTRYRRTCHSIAAASGKLGSVIVHAFLKYTRYSSPNSHNLGWVLVGFSGAMFLGAFFAWAWIPDIQNPRGSEPAPRRGGQKRFRKFEIPSKSLEELARGRRGVDDEDDVGIRHRVVLLLQRWAS